jgi:hypothetical protein
MRSCSLARLVVVGGAWLALVGCARVQPFVGARSIAAREWPAVHHDFDRASRRGYDPSRAFRP